MAQHEAPCDVPVSVIFARNQRFLSSGVYCASDSEPGSAAVLPVQVVQLSWSVDSSKVIEKEPVPSSSLPRHVLTIALEYSVTSIAIVVNVESPAYVVYRGINTSGTSSPAIEIILSPSVSWEHSHHHPTVGAGVGVTDVSRTPSPPTYDRPCPPKTVSRRRTPSSRPLWLVSHIDDRRLDPLP